MKATVVGRAATSSSRKNSEAVRRSRNTAARTTRRRLLLPLAAVLTCPVASAGDDLQVNTYTTNLQAGSSVASDADGDFVVFWHSAGSAGTDSSSFSIQGQRYASDGSPIGGQFQVNTYTTNSQASPSVASDADGDHLVVWNSDGSPGADSSSGSIQGRRYSSDGSPIGGQLQVNTYTTDSQFGPSVASDADGDFVVVWHSRGSAGTDSSSDSIQGQRYASNGSPIGGQFQVNTYTTNSQVSSSVASNADGDFVVVWHSVGSAGTDSSGTSIQGQRYASDGSPIGGELQVNTYTTGSQTHSSVASDAGGNFAVVWRSEGSSGTDSSDTSIQGQRFASDGSPIGGQFQVNTYTTNSQFGVSVVSDADGDLVVVWHSDGSSGTDSSGFSIQGQRFASDGSPIGGELQVNTYTTGYQSGPSVASDAGGDFVVVWDSAGSAGTDSSSYSVQRSEAAPVPVELQSFSVE